MFNDLHVIMYEGGKGNPFGHLGSAVNSDNTRGLYLKDGSSMWGGGGEIRPDVGSKEELLNHQPPTIKQHSFYCAYCLNSFIILPGLQTSCTEIPITPNPVLTTSTQLLLIIWYGRS
jgi:hypothetical protein